MDCPHCSPHSGRYRLGLSTTLPVASCWSCGRLPYLKTLHAVTQLPYEQLTPLFGQFRERTSEQKQRGKLIVPKSVVPLLDCHKRYLESRGFDWKEIAQTWGVQGIGLARRLAWRLWIPICDRRGDIVSWTTRAICDDVPHRYVNARPKEEAISLKDLLYGAELTRTSVIVCEGPTDVWRIGPGAVATLGIAYSTMQRHLLAQYANVTVCFDNEDDAQRKAERLCCELQGLPGQLRSVVLESGKDPGNAAEKELCGLREFLS